MQMCHMHPLDFPCSPWKKEMQANRDPKMDFEEYITKSIKINNEEFFKNISSKKQARIGPLNDKRIKGVLKENKMIDEKLNEFS